VEREIFPPQQGDKPRWAGRVSRHKIALLYTRDAQGILDEELIDEVGYALLARCQSIMQAEDVRDGKGVCPKCGMEIFHATKRKTVTCETCGWALSWEAYVKTTRKKQLRVGGIGPFLEEYLRLFPRAKTPQNRMIQIDNLIHRYHWELQGEPGCPSAVNLIGGKQREVMVFLNDLAYSDKSTPGLKENYSRWRKRGRRWIRKIEKEKKQALAKGEERGGRKDRPNASSRISEE